MSSPSLCFVSPSSSLISPNLRYQTQNKENHTTNTTYQQEKEMVNVDYISFSRCSSLHSSSLPSLTNDCLPHEEKQKATKLHHHGTVLSSTDKPSSSTSTCRRAVPLDPNSELRAVHASYTNSRVTRLLQVRAVAKQMAENKRKQVKDRKQRQQQQQQRNLDAQRFKMLSASLISECLELEQAKLHFGMAHHQALQTNLIQQQQNSNKQQQITQQNNTNNHRFNTALNQIKQSKQEKETERERKKQVKELSLVRQQHHLAHVIRPHNAWLADHDLKIYNEAHTKFGEQTTGTRKIKYTDTIQKPMPVTYTEKNTADMLASDLSDDDTVPLPSPVPTPYTPNTVAMHKQTTTNQLHIAQNPFTPLYSPIITKSSGIAWEIDRSALFDLPASNLSSISPLPSISSPAAPIPVFTPTSVFNTDIHENERLIYESKHIINTADSTTREENTQETTMESNTKENTDQQQHLQQSNGIDNDVPVILPKLPSPSLSFAMPASDLLFPLPAFVLSPAESASISSSVAESVSSVTIVSPPLSDHAALTTTAPPVAVSLVSTPPSLPSTQLPPRLANTLLLETIDYYLAQEKAKTIEVESILALSKVQSPPSVLSSLSPIVSPSVSSLWSPPLPVPSDSSDSENETSFNTSHIHSENKTENSNFVTPSAKHYFSLLKSLPSSVLSTVSPLPSTLDLSSDSFIQQSPAAHAIQQFITPIKHKHTTKREILQHLITQ